MRRQHLLPTILRRSSRSLSAHSAFLCTLLDLAASVCVLLVSWGAITTAVAQAESAAPPATANATALPVPYDEGMAAILSRPSAAVPFRVAPFGVAAMIAEPTDQEIIQLARALRDDPDLIYEYVRDTIEMLPQFGSLKGPLGTLLDGSGTAFDQAELMAVLLRQAGYTPTLVVGSVRLTAAELMAWLGSDSSVNSLVRIIGTGGFPGTLNVSGGQVTSADIGWAWVSVPIGGTSYVFDPAHKTHVRSSGLVSSLPSLLGYDQATFLSSALAGSTQTPSSIVGVNRANVRSDIASFANALRDGLKAQYPAAGPIDVLGGASIVPLPLNTRQRLTVLPNLTPGTTPTNYPGGFPDSLRAQLAITVPGAATITFNSSDIYGRRLSLFFNTAAQPQPVLSLEGQALVTGAPTTPGATVDIAAAVTHPYPTDFANQPRAGQPVPLLKVTSSPGGTFVIGTGWGQVGRGMIERHRRLLQQNIAASPGNPTAEPVLGQSLAMLGYTWLAQRARALQLIGQLGNVWTVYQHAVGIIGMQAPVNGVTGPYVDLPLNIFGIVQRTDRDASAETPAEASAFFVSANIGSVLESGTLEQTQPGQVAVSTVKLLDIWSQAGTIFDINNSAVSGNDAAYYYSTIRPVLAGSYPSGTLSQLDSLVNANRRLIAPSNGAIAVNNWDGVGYFDLAQDGGEIGAIISGGLSGGFATVNQSPGSVVADTGVSARPPAVSPVGTVPGTSQGNSAGFFGTISDPLNQVTGDYVYSNDDLSVGSGTFPYGLGLQRSYDSGRSTSTPGPLGPGWTHSFAYSIQPDSDGFEGMAVTSPQNGAIAIAAIHVLLDILNSTAANSKPLDRMVVAVQVTRQLMDQLTHNVLRVVQPGLTESFVRGADGVYGAPIGSASALTANIDGTFALRAKDRTMLNFGAAGSDQTSRIVSWANAAGAQVSFSYSGADLVSVTSNLGRSLQFGYTGDRLTSVSDGAGRSVGYGYDAGGRLISFQDPLGQVTSFTYDGESGRLTQIFSPSNPTRASVTNVYDPLGRVSRQVDGNGNTSLAFFAGRRSELEDPLGSRNAWYYDPLGRPIAEVRDFGYNPNGTLRLNLTTHHGYDGQARLVQTTQPEGNSVALTYSADMWQNVIAVVETPKPGSPLSPRTRSFTYEPIWQRVASMTDARGTVTTYGYDGRGNLAQVVADAGPGRLNLTSASTYDEYGRVLTEADPVGTVTRYTYDAFSNLTSVVADWGPGRLNVTTGFTHDAVGNPVTQTDPNGRTTTTTYDAARRVVSVTAPFPFDSGNSLVRTTNQYDPDGRVIAVTRTNGADPQVTRTEYSNTGQVLARADPNGHRTVFAYDAADRLERVTLPLAVGRTTRYRYDAAGRLVQLIDNTGTAAETYAYTANGRRASLTNGRGATTDYGYDGFDRLAQTLYPLGSTGTRTSEAFSYDAGDNVLTRTTRAGGVIGFAYDALGRLATKTPPSPAPVVSYAYDRAGRVIGVSDTSAAIPTVAVPPGTTVQYATAFSYDGLNRVTGTSWSPAPAAAAPAAPGSVTFTHSYNAANQRTGESTTDGTWWHSPPAVPSSVAYTANAADQYSAVGSITPGYDADGNLTFDGLYDYGYDAEGRLVSVGQGGSAVVTYAYDAQGRRKLRSAGGQTTVFVTDADGREVLEYGSDGQVLRWYAYGLGPNEVLAGMAVGTGVRETYVPDLLGSVIGAMASGSGVLTRRGYLPYGEGSGAAFAFAFTGQRLEEAAGELHDFRARHYLPGWGRFLQPDPIGYAGGINLYAYVGNDPLNAIDPSGLMAEKVGSAAWSLLPTDAQSYLSSSAEAASRAPDDIAALASSFLQDPIEAARSLGPSFGGVGAAAGRLPGYVAAVVGTVRTTSLSGPDIITFQSRHYAPRLEERGISVVRAEQMVRDEVSAMSRYMDVGSEARGRLLVDGKLVEFRVFRRSPGQVNVGTIFNVE